MAEANADLNRQIGELEAEMRKSDAGVAALAVARELLASDASLADIDRMCAEAGGNELKATVGHRAGVVVETVCVALGLFWCLHPELCVLKNVCCVCVVCVAGAGNRSERGENPRSGKRQPPPRRGA